MTKFVKTFFIAVMAVVLVSQSTVSAQSAGMATKSADAELKALVAKMKTEIDRRIAQTAKAVKALESSNAISSSSKNSVAAVLAKSNDTLQKMKKEIANVKDLQSAKKLASEIDAKYDEYATTNATAHTLKDSDSQQEVQTQMATSVDDAQALVDKAGASGTDVSNLQEQLKGVKQLVQSIGAIITSVIALIMSLMTGNFSEAATIFQTILGQLTQNMQSIETAQNQLGGMSIQLGSFGGNGGATTEN